MKFERLRESVIRGDVTPKEAFRRLVRFVPDTYEERVEKNEMMSWLFSHMTKEELDDLYGVIWEGYDG